MATERRYWDPERETMTLGNARVDQFGRLKPLLKWAYERSSHYRKSFDAAGVRLDDIGDFEAFTARVPFISKETLIAAERAEPPFGGFLTVPAGDLARIFVAPGPLYMPWTADDFDTMTDTAAMAMWCAGIRPSDIGDVTSTYHWLISGSMLDGAYRKVGCAVVPGGTGNTQMRLEAMRRLGVTTTYGFPTYFAHLAETAREMGLDLRKDLSLRVAMIGGELKPKQALGRLEQQYGMKIREIYGTADCGHVAFECDEQAGMHIEPHHIVEVIDPDTLQPVPEGEGGELVVTALFRMGMPCIRYRTGDIVAYVGHGSCPCGRHSPRLGPIVGRIGDIPRVKGMFIVPRQVEQALSAFEGLGQFQLLIERLHLNDVLTVRVEAAAGIDRSATRAAAQRALRDAIRIGAEVEIVDCGTLAPGSPLVVDSRKAEVTLGN